MKSILRALIITNLIAGFCLLVANSALAQSAQMKRINDEATLAPQIVSSVNCPDAQTFTSGSGASKFAFCITEHGNIKDLESPATFKQIKNSEGYVVSSSYDSVVHGFDTGLVEEGWGAPTIAQPGGPHTFPLAITRNSTDGMVQLKQTFNWDAIRKDILVTMIVKNLSSAPLSDVYLARYFDGDIDNDNNDDIYNKNGDSVWAYDNHQSHGLRLTALSFAIKHYRFAERYDEWAPNGSGSQNARHCFVNASNITPTGGGDYVGRITYFLGTINAGQSKTAVVLYSRF